MGRPREPVDLILAKGRTHMGRDEEEKRRSEEFKCTFTDIEPPEYLTEEQKRLFYYYTARLLALGIFTELDVDCLGRYVLAHDLYVKYSKALKQMLTMCDIDDISKVQNLQDKVFKQAQAAARDLGLTISSRCKLIVPAPPNDEDDDL